MMLSFNEALEQMKVILKSQGLTDVSCYRYICILCRFEKYHRNRGAEHYDPAVTKEFLMEKKNELDGGQISARAYRSYLRTAAIVNSIFSCTPVRSKYSYGNQYKYHLNDYYTGFLDRFASGLDMAESSVIGFCSVAREFFSFIQKKSNIMPDTLSTELLTDYLDAVKKSHPASMDYVMYVLRKISVFLQDEGYTVPNLMSQKTSRSRRRIYPCLDYYELDAVLSQPDRTTVLGKRDFAILVLASYTGIRAIDIANMKLTDIDWIHKEINIVQKKTGVPNSIPINELTAEAIADYILHGRPDTQCSYVFLTVNRPYRKLNDISSVRCILLRALKTAGIEKNAWDGKGFHSFRRGISVWMLETGSPMETISQVLGHTQQETIKHYLPISPRSLKICAMSLADIPVESEVYR